MGVFSFLKNGNKRKEKEDKSVKTNEPDKLMNFTETPKCMAEFVFYENKKIKFCNGWFIYLDGKGNNSLITHKRARQIELGYQGYQVNMDIERGGYSEDTAYDIRGFKRADGKYVYEDYRVDRLIDTPIAPIKRVLKIPREVNDIRINCIAERAFEDETHIVHVILPESIKEIGELAFAGCTNLSEIEVLSERINIRSDAFKDTAFFTGKKIIYINNTLMKVDPYFSGILKIDKGTTSIADNALEGCTELEEVILSPELMAIGRYAFEGCSRLQRILLPSSLQEIGANAFRNCENLKDVVFPPKMMIIETGAFAGCTALVKIDLPDGIKKLEGDLFRDCRNLMELHIPDSVTEICSNAFENSGVFEKYKNGKKEELYIDKWLISYKGHDRKVLRIKEGTIGIANMDFFEKKELCAVYFPESLKYIGADAFVYTNIDRIELPKNLRYIGCAAFRGTKIKEVLIPETVVVIEQWAFMDCEKLEIITVKGVKTDIIWPAITGRKDKKSILICAPDNPNAEKYCEKYGKKYNLVYKY